MQVTKSDLLPRQHPNKPAAATPTAGAGGTGTGDTGGADAGAAMPEGRERGTGFAPPTGCPRFMMLIASMLSAHTPRMNACARRAMQAACSGGRIEIAFRHASVL